MITAVVFFLIGIVVGCVVTSFMMFYHKPPSIIQPDLTGEHFIDDYGNYWAKVKK